MKKLFILAFTISILISCKKTPNVVIETPDKIKMVETRLIPTVYFEGDATWTIEERMKHYGVPGVSLAVINNHKIEWVKTYGVVDKETQEPVTKQTLFQAGSISKPVAAYGALKMVEQNKMDLDEDINTYLHSWKLPDSEFTAEKKVALKHLLNHSGGLTVHGFWGYSPDLKVPTLIEVLNGVPPANSDPIFVDKTPEESFRYSGGGYTILQQMMIDIEKKSFPELMDQLVLNPLAMNNSTYDQPLSEKQLKMAATGYLPNGEMTRGKRHTYPEMAAAGLWTTAEDLAKFAVNIQDALRGENTVVVSQQMANKMLTPFVEEYVGLGIFLNKRKNQTYFGHGGWDEGFSSELMAHKNKGYGVVVLTNSNHPDFINELIKSVAIAYEWTDFVPVYTKLDKKATALKKLSGRYRLDVNRYTEIYHQGNRLYKKNLGGEAIEFFKISDSTFISKDDDRIIQFKQNTEANTIDILVLNPHTHKTLTILERINEDEKFPLEFLVANNFDAALSAYQDRMTTNPNDPIVQESTINQLSYTIAMQESNIPLAQQIAKINTKLYPNSSNVYDSYAEASKMLGELDLAIENYKKAYALDPDNKNALNMIEELEKKKLEKDG